MRDVVIAEGIGAGYGGREVLHDVSLSVREKEFFIVAGPNGSGKSTLLKVLAALLPCRQGSILLFQRRLRHYRRRELAQKVAYLPQVIPLQFPFTVEEVVMMGRAPHLGPFRMEKRRDMDAARKAMEATQVIHLAHRRIDRLSGGERQRVFLAQALCQEPKLLLLDEPTAALDLAHQIRILDLLEEFRNRRALTVIMVSHDINLAALYGDRILLLKKGRVICQGPPAQVLTFHALEETYECPILVEPGPLGGVPRVLPVPGKFLDPEKRKDDADGGGSNSCVAGS